MAKKYMAGDLSRLEHHNIPDLPDQETPELMSDRQREALVANSLIKLGEAVGKVVSENDANERLMSYNAEMQSKLLELQEMPASKQRDAYNNGILDQVYKKHFEAGDKALGGAARSRFQKALNTNYQTSQVQAFKRILSVAKSEQSDIFSNLKAQTSAYGGQNYNNPNRDADGKTFRKELKKAYNLTDEQVKELKDNYYSGVAQNQAQTGDIPGLQKTLQHLSIKERAAYKQKMPVIIKDNKEKALKALVSGKPDGFLEGLTRAKKSGDPAYDKFATSIHKVFTKNAASSIKGRFNHSDIKKIMKNKPPDMSDQEAKDVETNLRYMAENHPDQLYEAFSGKRWADLSEEDRKDAGFLVTTQAADEIAAAASGGDPARLKALLEANSVSHRDVPHIIRLSYDGKIARTKNEKDKWNLNVAKFIAVSGGTGLPQAIVTRLGSDDKFEKLDAKTRGSVVSTIDEDKHKKLLAMHGSEGAGYLMSIHKAYILNIHGDKLATISDKAKYNKELGELVGKSIESAADSAVEVAEDKAWFRIFSNRTDTTAGGFFMTPLEWSTLYTHEKLNVEKNFDKLTLESLRRNKKFLDSRTHELIEDVATDTYLQKQKDGNYMLMMRLKGRDPWPVADAENRAIVFNYRKLGSNEFLPGFKEEPKKELPHDAGLTGRDKLDLKEAKKRRGLASKKRKDAKNR